MAQPASHVRWNGHYLFGSDVLLRKPDHAVLVATVIAGWAATEQHLGRAFGSLIGAKQPVTLSMYSAVRSFEVQRDILKAACKELLPRRYAMMAAACLDTLYKTSQARHRFAHWLWGMSTDPNLDALLLVEPKNFWQLHAAQIRHFRHAPLPAGEGPLSILLGAPRLNHEDIWVYRLGDLREEYQRIERAFEIAEGLKVLVAARTPRRQAIYRKLSAQPDLQKALKEVKRNWPKSRQEHPSPRGKAG